MPVSIKLSEGRELLRAFKVRVQFDQERLLRKRGEIVIYTIDGWDQVEGRTFFHPWYRLHARVDAGWDWEGAEQLTVTELAVNPRLVGTHRRQSIAKALRHLRGDKIAQFSLLAYEVGLAQYVILDGNHRFAAAYREKLPCKIMMVVIRANVDGEVCPDLNHHLSRGFPKQKRIPAPPS